MRRVGVLLLVVVLILTLALPVAAATQRITIVIDGKPLVTDAPAVLENGTTLVPMRAIFEALGASVQWIDATKTIIGTKGGKEIRLTLGQKQAHVGQVARELAVPAKLLNNRTYVPLRFISETLGATVAWDGATQTITISSASGEPTVTAGLPSGIPAGAQQAVVVRVVDGDTIEIATGEKIRLIGVDTPESVHPSKPVEAYGKEAAAFTRSHLEGKNVWLEYDVERTDKYGRLLAYVWLADSTMFNATLVKEGYAQVYTWPPNVKYVDLFVQLQQEAREAKRGLWSDPTVADPQTTQWTTQTGAFMVVARLSTTEPKQNSEVTVYVVVTDKNGKPIQGAAVSVVVNYKSKKTPYKGPVTNVQGESTITFKIGRATVGKVVPVDVTVKADGKMEIVRLTFTPK